VPPDGYPDPEGEGSSALASPSHDDGEPGAGTSGPAADPVTGEGLDGPELEARERYRELLEELRTIQPGVQVLFAFLLTAPFSQRFAELDRVGRDGYMVALIAAATAVVLFAAPTSVHRLAERDQRGRRLRLAVRLSVVGMAALLVAVASAVFVVTRFIFGMGEAVAIAGAVALLGVVLWYLVPLGMRLRGS
jgi:hypothetical protein